MVIPSIWQLFLPNLTGNTLLGVILLIIGVALLILDVIFLLGVPMLFKFVGIIGIIIIAVGLLLTFAVSFVQDILNSQELTIASIGVILLIGLGIYLFYNPKKRKRK